jgi:hypothetical protein
MLCYSAPVGIVHADLGFELLTQAGGIVTSLSSGLAWDAETAPSPSTDPVFGQIMLKPKRIGGKVMVSSMLLKSSPDAEHVIRSDWDGT